MDLFNNKLECYINTLSKNKQNKYTIKNYMYDSIIHVLKSKDINTTAKFKFWVRKTFQLIEIGSSEIVYDRKKKLPLVTHENIFAKIAECHSSVGHAGRDKTWAEVK